MDTKKHISIIKKHKNAFSFRSIVFYRIIAIIFAIAIFTYMHLTSNIGVLYFRAICTTSFQSCSPLEHQLKLTHLIFLHSYPPTD